MRKLASIQEIIDLKPIEGADMIEIAKVLGWNVVVKKGEFSVGDLCVYFEIDSLLPMTKEFEFLAKNGTKKMIVEGKEVEGYRLRTIRLKGQISQGLCLPCGGVNSILPSQTDVFEGKDVTDILGVYKYEPPIPAQLVGQMRSSFPSFIPKTDETRIQSFPELLQKYKDIEFYVTEKLDGSSGTFFVKDGELHVCSRNIDLLATEDNTFWKVARNLKLFEILAGTNYALQGEVIGEGIQNNKLGIKGQEVRFFNMFDMETGVYVDMHVFLEFMVVNLLPVVPIVNTSFKLLDSVDEMVSLATKKSVLNPSVWAEGFVFRPVHEIRDEDLGRLSFKVINPEFLISNKE